MYNSGLYKLTVLLAVVFFLGCGNSMIKVASSTVIVAGQAWMEADAEFAPAYEQARIEARESSSSWQERDEQLASWEKARDALAAAGLAIKTAALSISIMEDGFQTDWSKQTLKAIKAATSAFQMLKKLGIETPIAILSTLEKGKKILQQ